MSSVPTSAVAFPTMAWHWCKAITPIILSLSPYIQSTLFILSISIGLHFGDAPPSLSCLEAVEVAATGANVSTTVESKAG